MQPSQQGRRLGIFGRTKAVFFQFRQCKMIQITFCPGRVLRDRRLVGDWFLKGPEPPTRFNVHRWDGSLNLILLARVYGPHPDPGFEIVDHGFRQTFLFGRHPEVEIGVRDGRQQQTRVRVTRHDRRTTVATRANRCSRVESQSTF